MGKELEFAEAVLTQNECLVRREFRQAVADVIKEAHEHQAFFDDVPDFFQGVNGYRDLYGYSHRLILQLARWAEDKWKYRRNSIHGNAFGQLAALCYAIVVFHSNKPIHFGSSCQELLKMAKDCDAQSSVVKLCQRRINLCQRVIARLDYPHSELMNPLERLRSFHQEVVDNSHDRQFTSLMRKVAGPHFVATKSNLESLWAPRLLAIAERAAQQNLSLHKKYHLCQKLNDACQAWLVKCEQASGGQSGLIADIKELKAHAQSFCQEIALPQSVQVPSLEPSRSRLNKFELTMASVREVRYRDGCSVVVAKGQLLQLLPPADNNMFASVSLVNTDAFAFNGRRCAEFVIRQNGDMVIFRLSGPYSKVTDFAEPSMSYHLSIDNKQLDFAAGKIIVEHGVLKTIADWDGDITHEHSTLYSTLQWFKLQEVNLESTEVVFLCDGNKYAISAIEFLKLYPKEASALNCFELLSHARKILPEIVASVCGEPETASDYSDDDSLDEVLGDQDRYGFYEGTACYAQHRNPRQDSPVPERMEAHRPIQREADDQLPELSARVRGGGPINVTGGL